MIEKRKGDMMYFFETLKVPNGTDEKILSDVLLEAEKRIKNEGFHGKLKITKGNILIARIEVPEKGILGRLIVEAARKVVADVLEEIERNILERVVDETTKW